MHIRPNEGTFYASTVAAEVHTVRRADLTQKITENTELFVFGPWLPQEKQPGAANKTAKKASSSGSTVSSSGAAAATASSTANSLIFLWPLVVPSTSSDSTAVSTDTTQQPASSSVESTNPSNAASTMGTKRLITFDRSDPEFDEDDDPDADLDL